MYLTRTGTLAVLVLFAGLGDGVVGRTDMAAFVKVVVGVDIAVNGEFVVGVVDVVLEVVLLLSLLAGCPLGSSG